MEAARPASPASAPRQGALASSPGWGKSEGPAPSYAVSLPTVGSFALRPPTSPLATRRTATPSFFPSMPVALRSVVALVALTLAGCDAAPGFADEVPRPILAEVAITPAAFSLDGDAPTATVPLAVSGTLDAEGAVEVRVLVRYAETDSLVTEASAEVAGGAFRVEAPVTIPRGATGEYSVRVTTEGADGRAGDQAAAVLRFDAANLGPPVVAVNTPSAVTRPTGTRTVTVPLVATVTDPDGRANVLVVVAQVPDGGGVIGRLFDDGENQDQTADDGRYSAGIVVDASFEPGTYALEIVAIDRAGAESAPAPYTFTVQ